MQFTRKQFIKTSSLLAAGLFLPANKLLFALSQNSGNLQVLRNNTGIFTERGGTIGWHVSDDAVVIIDSQFPDTAENFVHLLKEKTSRKIDMLINTHHHGDHTAGNYYFKEYVKEIVANKKAVELQKKFYGSGENADKQVYANVTFTDEFKADIGKEKLTARHFWHAHTGGDAIIHFENDNVVHMGDIVFNRVYPYMDRPAGTTIEGWIKFLEKCITTFDSDTIFIFGHAVDTNNVSGNRDDLVYMKNYLSGLLDYVKKQIDEGKTKDKIVETGPVPNFENHKELWPGALKMSLTATYEELTS